MEKDQIKEAFSKVKQDMSFLARGVSSLKNEINELRIVLKDLYEDVNNLKMHEMAKKNNFFKHNSLSTDSREFKTYSANTTDNTTVPQEIEGLNSSNLSISTGNEGVSTDRQTDNTTDISTQNTFENSPPLENTIESSLHQATEILDSLDLLKKEIRLKFKRVTTQEMAVFSTIYQLEEKDPHNNSYKQIAFILRLSESSIRDYVQRMIIKGIPIKKNKINNRKVILSISPELKKIATLSTILQLREL